MDTHLHLFLPFTNPYSNLLNTTMSTILLLFYLYLPTIGLYEIAIPIHSMDHCVYMQSIFDQLSEVHNSQCITIYNS